MAKDRMDVQLAEVRLKHPDWYVWYEQNGRGKTVWFAGRPSNLTPAFEAGSADELDADLSRDPDFWLTSPGGS